MRLQWERGFAVGGQVAVLTGIGVTPFVRSRLDSGACHSGASMSWLSDGHPRCWDSSWEWEWGAFFLLLDGIREIQLYLKSQGIVIHVGMTR